MVNQMLDCSVLKKALTLIEILVSMLILAITMAGLTNLYISGKKWLMHSRSRMTSGELGKHFLDPLQMQVRQDQWGNNCMSNQTTTCCSDPQDCQAGTAQGLDKNYNATYNVTPSFNGTTLSKVKVNITWPKE